MPRRFNVAGPCRPDWHYRIDAARRLPEAPGLVEQRAYFVVHAPRQTGKTTAIRALAAQLTASGRYASVVFSCEAAGAWADDIGAERAAVHGDDDALGARRHRGPALASTGSRAAPDPSRPRARSALVRPIVWAGELGNLARCLPGAGP